MKKSQVQLRNTRIGQEVVQRDNIDIVIRRKQSSESKPSKDQQFNQNDTQSNQTKSTHWVSVQKMTKEATKQHMKDRESRDEITPRASGQERMIPQHRMGWNNPVQEGGVNEGHNHEKTKIPTIFVDKKTNKLATKGVFQRTQGIVAAGVSKNIKELTRKC